MQVFVWIDIKKCTDKCLRKQRNGTSSNKPCLILIKFVSTLGKGSTYNMLLNCLQHYVSFKLYLGDTHTYNIRILSLYRLNADFIAYFQQVALVTERDKKKTTIAKIFFSSFQTFLIRKAFVKQPFQRNSRPFRFLSGRDKLYK